jgi:hypothetical protein
MAEHSIRAQREQASLVLESLLHLIKVLLDDDRSPSGEVNARRHYSLHLDSPVARPHPTGSCRNRMRTLGFARFS